MALACFKTYDIRGRLGSELNEDISYRIGRAFGLVTKAKSVVIGGDARATSPALAIALSNGLRDSGVNVIDLGLAGTEEIYFATSNLDCDGGIVITASHNPIDYNGMKLVVRNSKPISRNSGLNEIEQLTETQPWLIDKSSAARGSYQRHSNLDAYISHLFGYITPSNIKPMKLVVNAGNGAAGHVIDALEQQFTALKIPVEFIKIHHQPDSNFPNGIPNPLLVENRASTRNAVIEHKADLGIAWDGDFDRCFLFDERGEFIEGYYIVGLLAQAFLAKENGAKIIHDPRLTWNTQELVSNAGGQAIESKTGHAFIKERMRDEDAIYGGEMSAHHYFRDFFYCDSGMIPWLLIIELLSKEGISLSQAVNARQWRYPSSGEINLRLTAPAEAIAAVKAHFLKSATKIDEIDGLSMAFENNDQRWRFNLRSSNTEPVVRLNIESFANNELMKEKTALILSLLQEINP
ncbi:phosphomannomutase CpsG [Psychrobium sp. MM17-31]|uniref:phosphomannomutase CpsG n=1 Tax=Psychrobium sp. MM17-31 TaxID=2917758 RepID=UPI001EF412B7|nr:phosphomannomutase CpsG [Psychrobium sp. MM17-31]MCG7531321.1 phosphomannomutase CpsG [Psychrobium sp. MM17-31]